MLIQIPTTSTPTKKREEIEKLRNWLSSEWGLTYTEHDPVYKPIRFLTFQKGDAEGALQHAFDLFDEAARKLRSDWITKPRADTDLLPSRVSEHLYSKDNFLQKQGIPRKDEQNLLMNSLLEKVTLVCNRLRANLPYREEPMKQSVEHVSCEDAKSPLLKGKKSQSRIDAFLRSKSAPNPPSSQFSDSDAESIFRNEPSHGPMPPPDQSLEKRTSHESSGSDYRTPPTTPDEIQPVKRSFKRSITEASSTLDAQVGQPRKRSSNLSFRSTSEGSMADSASTVSTTSTTGSVVASTAASSNVTSPNTSFSTTTYSNTVSRNPSFSDANEDTIRAVPPADFEKAMHHQPMQIDSLPQPARTNTSTLPPIINWKASSSTLLDTLKTNSPFDLPIPKAYSDAPFNQLYEVQRVVQHCRLDFSLFGSLLHRKIADYDEFWASLTAIIRKHSQIKPPERSHKKAWEGCTRMFEEVYYTGSLEYSHEPTGPFFQFKLKALRADDSHRLARKFGTDRFMRIGFPGFEAKNLPTRLKIDQEASQNSIIDWLVECNHFFLGRQWRAFFVKPNRSLKFVKGGDNEDRFHLYFFAEDGHDFIDRQLPGEIDQRHVRRSVTDMLHWLFPPDPNADQPALKLFARLTLAVSKTKPTVIFKRHQIFYTRDACSHDPRKRSLDYNRSCKGTSQSCSSVMNDGCARISQAAAVCVKERLGLDFVPCAVQGRIDGAKGMWIVDPLCEKPFTGEIWIEITDSQSKYKGHKPNPLNWDPNEGRHTLEINDFVKRLTPASLNFQLMPILTYGGVPHHVFHRLLENDLTAKVSHLKAATDDCRSLRLWSQRNNPVAEERTRQNGIEFCGGLPNAAAEKINWFLDSGFDPMGNQFLKEVLFNGIKGFCTRLEESLGVVVGRSTYAFMISDPTGILKEDEVHFAFSNSFNDDVSGFEDTMLHDLDVLVARLPAHLPSDIQKVRAVFKPELKTYRDVIVFPSTGPCSLASKLSGGDYDGDRAWVCWDPQIVQSFKNSNVPPELSYREFGITKDDKKASSFIEKDRLTTAFLRHGFQFNLQPGMLGKCTHYHEALCYNNTPIDDPRALAIGMLLGLLVDSAKAGLTFTDTMWKHYLKPNQLKPSYHKPKYKESTKHRQGSDHLIDFLVFKVAREVSTKALKDLWQPFKDTAPRDEELLKLSAKEHENAKANAELKDVLNNLWQDIERLHNDFTRNSTQSKDYDNSTSTKASASDPKFRAVAENCRAEFIALSPRLTNGKTQSCQSDRIRDWQQTHAKGEPSYWDLLKASVAYAGHSKSKFVWHMAGLELGEIKATARGRATYRCVRNEIFNGLRVDARFIEGIKRREDFEGMVAKGAEGLIGDSDGDDDTEYGTCPVFEDAFS